MNLVDSRAALAWNKCKRHSPGVSSITTRTRPTDPEGRTGMIVYGVLVFLSIALFEMILFFELKADILEIVTGSRESMRILTSSGIDDRKKEALSRRASARLARATMRFALKLLCIGFVLYLLSMAVTRLAPSIEHELFSSLFSLSTVVLLTIAVILYGRVRRTIFRDPH